MCVSESWKGGVAELDSRVQGGGAQAALLAPDRMSRHLSGRCSQMSWSRGEHGGSGLPRERGAAGRTGTPPQPGRRGDGRSGARASGQFQSGKQLTVVSRPVPPAPWVLPPPPGGTRDESPLCLLRVVQHPGVGSCRGSGRASWQERVRGGQAPGENRTDREAFCPRGHEHRATGTSSL